MAETLGQRIRRLRKSAGYSQKSLAHTLIMTNEAVSLWEHNRRTPSTNSMIRLAAALRVDEAYLRWGSGDSRQRPAHDPEKRLTDLKAAVLRWTISKRPVADLQRLVSEA